MIATPWSRRRRTARWYITPFTATRDPLQRYLHGGSDHVEGWLDRYSAAVIADLTRIQQVHGIAGAFGEIGVHHGKLFILMRLAAPNDRGFAIDVFGDQQLNVDRSGRGDRAKFLHNVAHWTGSIDDIAVVQNSSLDVSPDFLLKQVGRCRLVSIDGGHTEECTLNDLNLSEAILQERGVAIVDDCFDEEWPDVATGMARYCLDPGTALRPFAISPHKVYLARRHHHAFYRQRLEAAHADNLKRISRMFGSEVAIFRSPSRYQRAKAALGRSRWGPGLRWVRQMTRGKSVKTRSRPHEPTR